MESPPITSSQGPSSYSSVPSAEGSQDSAATSSSATATEGPGKIGPFSVFGTGKEGKINSRSLLTGDYKMSALASFIKGITAGVSSLGSAIKSIAWSAYHAVVSSPDNDKVKYSSTTISGECLNGSKTGQSLAVPTSGTFEAGAELRRRLTANIFERMVKLTLPDDSDRSKGLSQLHADVSRIAEFSTIDENKNRTIVSSRTSTDIEPTASSEQDPTRTNQQVMFDNVVDSFRIFTNQNKFLADAIMGITNQTLINVISLELPSNSEASSLRVESAVGFPTTSRGIPTSAKYELQRNGPVDNPDHFILSLDVQFKSTTFLLNEEDRPGTNSVALDTPIKVHHFISLKITPNPNFDQKSEESADNFPCSLEVLTFTSSYKKAQDSQEPEGD